MCKCLLSLSIYFQSYNSFPPVSIYCAYCLFMYVQFSCCPLRALNWSINWIELNWIEFSTLYHFRGGAPVPFFFFWLPSYFKYVNMFILRIQKLKQYWHWMSFPEYAIPPISFGNFFQNVYFLCGILKNEHGHGFHILDLFLFVILIFFLGLKTITCRDTLYKGILKITENITATRNAKLGLPTTATFTHFNKHR